MRVSHPTTDIPCQWSGAGPRGNRPRCALSPKRPQQAAGTRIDPAPSEPRAAPTRPAATAAAEPPLEPPGERSRSQGLRVTPHVGDSVTGSAHSGGTFVRPRTMAPAARTRRTTSQSSAAGSPYALGSVRRHVARHVDVVLDRERHAEERALVPRFQARRGLVGLREGALAVDGAERVELRVEARDAPQVELHEVARRELPAADELGLAGDRGEGEGVVHGTGA